uniref:Uncharacterized protein n=1 Tax=Fagus sylvatica TaxID=28930 RepID=A0A2N9ENM3_FAGSY
MPQFSRSHASSAPRLLACSAAQLVQLRFFLKFVVVNGVCAVPVPVLLPDYLCCCLLPAAYCLLPTE